jgi:hypothetical protein
MWTDPNQNPTSTSPRRTAGPRGTAPRPRLTSPPIAGIRTSSYSAGTGHHRRGGAGRVFGRLARCEISAGRPGAADVHDSRPRAGRVLVRDAELDCRSLLTRSVSRRCVRKRMLPARANLSASILRLPGEPMRQSEPALVSAPPGTTSDQLDLPVPHVDGEPVSAAMPSETSVSSGNGKVAHRVISRRRQRHRLDPEHEELLAAADMSAACEPDSFSRPRGRLVLERRSGHPRLCLLGGRARRRRRR